MTDLNPADDLVRDPWDKAVNALLHGSLLGFIACGGFLTYVASYYFVMRGIALYLGTSEP